MWTKLQALRMIIGSSSTSLYVDKVSYFCFEFLKKSIELDFNLCVPLQQHSKLYKMLNQLARQYPLNSTRIYSLSLTRLFLRKVIKFNYRPSIMLCSMVVQDLLETIIKIMLTAMVFLTRTVIVEVIINHSCQIMNFRRIRSLTIRLEINSSIPKLSLSIHTYNNPCLS